MSLHLILLSLIRVEASLIMRRRRAKSWSVPIAGSQQELDLDLADDCGLYSLTVSFMYRFWGLFRKRAWLASPSPDVGPEDFQLHLSEMASALPRA